MVVYVVARVIVQDLKDGVLWPSTVASIVEREEEGEARCVGRFKRQLILRLIALVVRRVEGKGVDMSS